GLEERLDGGNFVNLAGEVVGQHKGYPFYTIGQRKGLGVAFGNPKYVTEIRPETNTVVLGDMDDLLRNGMVVGKVNSMKYPSIPSNMDLITQIRYNDPGVLAKANHLATTVEVEFMANVRGVAPGQSAVFYEGDDVVGGGIIQSSLK
ncbi:MAG: tRNA methyl transferase PRC-barrel domain-containing protein, partial [Saprospiraceae bacterium]